MISLRLCDKIFLQWHIKTKANIIMNKNKSVPLNAKPIKSRTVHILLAAALCLSFAACGPKAPADNGNKPDNQSASKPPEINKPEATGGVEMPGVNRVQLSSFEISDSMKNAYEYDYAEYNLGEKSLISGSGWEMPYKVRGVIAAPKGEGLFPLVLIAHGAHEEEDESKRFDTGFEYLVKALAQNGYVAVSMDMLMPYIQSYGGNDDYIEKMLVIADDHVQGLRLANSGEDLFSIALSNKIDFERVAILGHSRSGSAVFQIAKEQQDKDLGIGALLSLAPSADFWVDYIDIPVAFLVPQYDGDVIQLDGMFMYDFIEDKIDENQSATLLMGANHNFFNSNLERDDTIADEMENPFPPLTREEQENFLASFAVDFFNTSFDIGGDFYGEGSPQPNKMYGRDINRLLRIGQPINLVNPAATDEFSGEGVSIRHVVDSIFYNQDEVLINTVTTSILKTIVDETFDPAADLEYVPANRDLISLEWLGKDARAVITPLVSDFSGRDFLSIEMVMDSASELNNPDRAASVTVILKDAAGNEAHVALAEEQNVLSCYPGRYYQTELTEDFTIEYWEPTTPMGMITIPLSYFEGVDISAIQSVEFLFNNSECGAVFIASCQLQ